LCEKIGGFLVQNPTDLKVQTVTDLLSQPVGYLLLQNLTDLQVQNPTTLPLADLAATYSPAS
jgi:hypothetical protein